MNQMPSSFAVTMKFGQLSLLLATLFVCGCERQSPIPAPAAAPPVQVRLTTVKKGEATRSITLPADIQPYQQATLYAKVTGYIKTVNVDKGDTVSPGAVLAEIEVPELLADRARYKAEAEIAALDFRRA